MARITLIARPHDSAGERMGRGPVHLLESGLAESLRAPRHDVKIVTLRLPETFHAEGQALVELHKLTVATVHDALARNRRPLILSGNCGPAAPERCLCARGSESWRDLVRRPC